MSSDSSPPDAPRHHLLITVAWLWVTAPLAYGVYELLQKVTQLFTG